VRLSYTKAHLQIYLIEYQSLLFYCAHWENYSTFNYKNQYELKLIGNHLKLILLSHVEQELFCIKLKNKATICEVHLNDLPLCSIRKTIKTTIMKRKLLLASILFPAMIMAQNVQLHYDLGKNRNYITTTFEMFKPDKWGNTFFFVDYDYNLDANKNVGMSYMEIARCFSLGKNSPLSAQIEYNGGLLAFANNPEYLAFPINNAFLVGLDYGWHSENFSKTANLKLLYKNILGKNRYSFQITGVWDLNFYNRKLTFSGFADFWKEDNINLEFKNEYEGYTVKNTKFVFMTEPQIWYNFTPNISVGSEVEVACNFGSVNGWKVCPTLAAKWNF